MICDKQSNKTGKVFCQQSDLHLRYTLNAGQCYRWREIKHDHWIGVLDHKVWILSQNEDFINYQIFTNENESNKSEEINFDVYDEMLTDFFRLNVSLKEFYSKWSKDDPFFNKISEIFYGIRIMKQDILECIFSFICSSNNFLSRISAMVEKICTFYGEKICIIDGNVYYDFPKIEKLARSGVSEKLREAGFGFRAKYIQQAAEKIITFGGNDWLNKLKLLDYKDSKAELMKLPGIGAKILFCADLRQYQTSLSPFKRKKKRIDEKPKRN
ncbi:N-glycosylase/DNA lyase-like isoform X2 [Lycorma delicatula]|uniref:N-glycosylase/DNA lyase-like isoform X2 n=1 Tax=Lycorma delicatula TaxID=130591 RepID=UPI003F5125FC